LPAERSSLARFTHLPNLDEHFTSALLYFAGEIGDDLLKQIHDHPLHPVPDLANDISGELGKSLRQGAAEIDVRLTQSILDRHSAADGFFYVMMAGRTLGTLDVIFQPTQPDPLVIGRIDGKNSQAHFQIWSALRPASVASPMPTYQITGYHIDTTIHTGLSMSSTAEFDYRADADDGAVIALQMTPRLRANA
jgi:hypothetical protein